MNEKMRWEAASSQFLVGKTIKEVRYLTDDEMNDLGWYNKSIVIIFSDDSFILPSKDEEGNGPGVLFTSVENFLIPTL